MTPKISVLMGIYNCAATLPDAIDSILAQTYPHWELIMCDDGSKDDTYAVAEGYRQRYPDKIILLQNEQNMGLNKTLNRCLELATGAYIARMDGDDLSMPERFEKEITFLESRPDLAIVSCPMVYFDEKGEWGWGREIPKPRFAHMIFGTPHCHAPCMVRTEAFRAVKGYSEDPRTLRAEDYDLWFRMYGAGFRGENLPDFLYKMRDDENAFHRRKFKYALHETYVRWHGYRLLKIPFWGYPVALRPIIVGLLPKFIYQPLHRYRLRKRKKVRS